MACRAIAGAALCARRRPLGVARGALLVGAVAAAVRPRQLVSFALFGARGGIVLLVRLVHLAHFGDLLAVLRLRAVQAVLPLVALHGRAALAVHVVGVLRLLARRLHAVVGGKRPGARRTQRRGNENPEQSLH